MKIDVDKTTHPDTVEQLRKLLIAEHRLIEAAWIILCAVKMPATAGDAQRKELREAFFRGAKFAHLSVTTHSHELTEEQALRILQNRWEWMHDELRGAFSQQETKH